jgi:hypothetical protein
MTKSGTTRPEAVDSARTLKRIRAERHRYHIPRRSSASAMPDCRVILGFYAEPEWIEDNYELARPPAGRHHAHKLSLPI